jgi:pimeloyl-ACP methyl ester carboxylesterase
MLIVLFVLLAFILMVVGIVLAWSPGKPKPFLNENGKALSGSISEKIHVSINGVEQGMFIRSRNKENPVLLFIHGGPGMPEYFLAQSNLSALRTATIIEYKQ